MGDEQQVWEGVRERLFPPGERQRFRGAEMLKLSWLRIAELEAALAEAVKADDARMVRAHASNYERCFDCDYPGTCSRETGCPSVRVSPARWAEKLRALLPAAPDLPPDQDDERVPEALVEYGKAEGLICRVCGYGMMLCKCSGGQDGQ